MTIWDPEIDLEDGPRYMAIANALGVDIERGALNPGQQLPTQRDLAETLGVTVGTVSRAYREAEGRGLVVGEVGRGTFVRQPDRPHRAGTAGARDESLIDLSLNFMRMPDGEILVPQALAQLARDPAVVRLLEEYKPQAGLPAHREAGAIMAREAGLSVQPDQILVCGGGQHAMTVALMGLVGPGDHVLTGELTYPTLRALARSLHLPLHGLPMDAEGIEPEALDEACHRFGPKVLYTMPTLHNPTSRTMSPARREAIVQVAAEHGLAILEDDVSGFLSAARPPPLAALYPERSYYFTSCSKSIAPGLRVGYLVVPRRGTGRFLDALWSTAVMAPPLMAEIASRWIHDGTAAALARARRAEGRARQRIAREYLEALDDCTFEASPNGHHLWLYLPEPWASADSFVSRAMAMGVALTPGSAFSVESSPAAVRLSLGAPASREDLRRGLERVTDLLLGTHPIRVV